jgi:CRP-like cAMP-binding protein
MDERIYHKKEFSNMIENARYDARLSYAKSSEAEDRCFAKRPETPNKPLKELLPEKILANLLQRAERVEFSTRDFIYQPGEKINYLYFPETLVASEFQILEDGRTVELALIGNDGFIGAFSFCPDRNALNWTQPIIPGTALKIEAEEFTRLSAATQKFPALIAPYLENYVRQLSQKAVCLCFHHIEARLCTWLLMLAARVEENAFRLTHEQIARSIGVHRPSITQITKSLREKAIIDTRRGEIVITNLRKLEEMACECFYSVC